MSKPRIVCVVGTRPDAIKSAPVVQELRRFAQSVECVLVSTGQHREMLAQALEAFDLQPDEDLGIMQPGQTLAQITQRALGGLDSMLERLNPDLVMAQGDTSTTFCAALAAFYRRIPFGHIEAGLRTPRIDDPFPEEFNRRAAALVTAQHYAPTPWSANNLLAERVPAESVFITGNTGIDAVLQVAERGKQDWYPEHSGRVVLLTTHRRENWGEPQRRIAAAARRVLDAFDDVLLVVPMHKNPAVREVLVAALGDHPRTKLIEPPAYADFVTLMRRSALALTDSGGVQEEAPTFGLPALVLRETTERPEGVEAGAAKLIGTDEERIFTEASALLSGDTPRVTARPYGDGRAAARIRHAALALLGVESPEEPAWV